MTTTRTYHAAIMEVLSPLGPITSRAMFGGYGIYYNKVMFAALFEDDLYFRVDDQTIGEYEKAGSEPFVYEGNGKSIRMPYMTLPTNVFENSTLLVTWIKKACEASIRYKLKKPKRKAMKDKL